MKFKNTALYLKSFRESTRLTQASVGHLIGCHTQMISNAERGVSTLPFPKVKRLKQEFKHFEIRAFIKAFAKDHALFAADKAKRALRNKYGKG